MLGYRFFANLIYLGLLDIVEDEKLPTFAQYENNVTLQITA